MKNIAVIFGGKSVEHDISIITAMQTISHFPREYNLIPIYITKDGKYVTAQNLTDPNVFLNFTKKTKKLREILFDLGKNEIFKVKNNKIKKRIKIDCALLCTHGHGGEDGALQGLLELCEIPYTSPSLSASAITIDKALTKSYLLSAHINTPAYEQFSECQYKIKKQKIIEDIVNKIEFPCVVKPARLGSSIGINICTDEKMLKEAINYALNFDNKIVVEKFIDNAKEFCCAAVRDGNKVYLSKIKQVHKGDIFTFDEKYLGSSGTSIQKIDEELERKIKNLCKKVYDVLELDGVVRIDFLYSENDHKLYVNEPNTIPGSLAFDMFDGKFEDLQKLMIEAAIKKHKAMENISYSFNSEAIKNFIEMSTCEKFNK